MSRLPTLLFGAAAAGAAAYFLDRRSGGHRLNQLKGAAARATPTGTKIEDVDDVTLARKVETEIFRPADAPKGDVSVDVQAGVVYLRGTVDDDAWIERLADGAQRVDGVTGVKNLLHRPGTPAPAAEPRGAVSERR